MKKFYMFLMIGCICFLVLGISLLLFNRHNTLAKINDDDLVYSSQNFAEEFNICNYKAEIVYYKESEKHAESSYSVLKYEYKNNIEKFNDYQNQPYEFDDFTSKKQYLKTGNSEDKKAYTVKDISYDSYHSMLFEILKNSKYNGEETYILKTPSEIIKKFLESFNDRAGSSIAYKEGKKYKIYVKVKNTYVEEFVLLDGNNRISFIFSSINQVDDINLPDIK